MDTKQGVLDILNDLTGEDLSDQMDENIFDNGLMDSMASVQMLLSLQESLILMFPFQNSSVLNGILQIRLLQRWKA